LNHFVEQAKTILRPRLKMIGKSGATLIPAAFIVARESIALPHEHVSSRLPSFAGSRASYSPVRMRHKKLRKKSGGYQRIEEK
jgi:hypothetical protein